MAAIEFDRVTKRFPDGTVAVDDVSLDVQDGEFMILVGPSGCGKTTALRMVAGLEEITDGEIRIGERVVNALEPKERDVAMVFQSYALYPHMSVRDNIAFPLKMQKVPRAEIEERVAGRRPAARARRAPAPQAARAVRRAAPARGDGPGDRAAAAGVPDGRAALEPGREAAGPDARRAREPPSTPRRHDAVRHPRSDRGDDARPAGRRAEQGHRPAGGRAADALPSPREHVRRRASSARRR